MARGRKGQPAEVKDAKGNPGKRPTGAVAMDDLPALTESAPPELSADGKKIWAQVSKHLRSINLLRMTDRFALARYCDTLADYWKVTKDLRKKHHTYEAEKVGGGTMLRVNPLFMVQDRLSRRLDTLEDRFGLSPRARQEIFRSLAAAPPGQLPFDAPPPDDDEPGDADGDVIGFLGRTGPRPGDAVN